MATKPTCGSGSASTTTTFSDLSGIAMLLVTLISSVVGIVSSKGAIELFLTTIQTFLGISAPMVYWLSALAAYFVVLVVIGVFFYKNCHDKPAGLDTCSAGVIERVFPSFDEWQEWAFPFSACHPRIDVVVKSDYWHLVDQGGATVVCNSDPQRSPILSAFFHSREVCAAGAGALVGAAIAGIGGIIAGVAIGAAIGCAASGPFYLFCLLAVLLVVAIVVAAIALAGALVGGMIGKAAAGGTDPTRDDSMTIGDYVTTPGNLIIMGDLDKARAYWFVKNSGHSLSGRSTGSAPFSHVDPDANLVPDSC